jgi:DNA-binding transcriptional LysR family regulator
MKQCRVLDDLELFVAVVDAGSFTEAARRLARPKATISRAVAALEERLGVVLLHRTTRTLRVTTAGAELHSRAAAALGTLRNALSLAEKDEEPRGVVRMTTTVDFAATALPVALTRFLGNHPAVEVDLHVSNRVVDFVGEGIDLAIRFSVSASLPDSPLRARSLGDAYAGLYASPSYLARAGTPKSLEDLAAHTGVFFHGSGMMAGAVLAGGGLALSEPGPKTRWRCDDMFVVRGALRAGAGIGLLPAYVAEDDRTSGTLVRVLPHWEGRVAHAWLVHAAGPLPRKTRVLRDHLLEVLPTFFGPTRAG